MMSVTGNCSYKFDNFMPNKTNYVLPDCICRLEEEKIVVQEKYAYIHRSDS
jgi:hypothetical protein